MLVQRVCVCVRAAKGLRPWNTSIAGEWDRLRKRCGESERENMKKKSYKKKLSKIRQKRKCFRKKKLLKTFISSAKKLYKVEGMNGKQVFTRLSMFDCGSWEDQTCNVFRREWENSISSEAKHKKLFLLLSFLAFINFTSFYSFSFYVFSGRRQQQPERDKLLFDQLLGCLLGGKGFVSGRGGRLGRAKGPETTPSADSGITRNRRQKPLKWIFWGKMSFYVAGKVVAKSEKIKFSSASG